MLFGVGLGHESTREVGALARQADELGFDNATLVHGPLTMREHHMMMTIAALNTERIKLGQGVAEASSYHPTQIANAAATLRAGPWDRFVSVALPLARPGFVTAGILGFAHTVGEFGVVLMIGGNIPGKTRVVSVQIFDHVEALEYAQAHWLAGGMVVFSFIILLLLYSRRQRATAAL